MSKVASEGRDLNLDPSSSSSSASVHSPRALNADSEGSQVFPSYSHEGVLLTDEELMRFESRAESTALILSRRLTGADSLVSAAKESKKSIPPMGGENRDYPPPIEDIERYMVTFAGVDDPRHPHNWSNSRKIRTFACYAFSGLCGSLGSSMFSAGNAQVSELFGVGEEVSALGTSLFVAGFGSGPVIWGPLSEVYGRKIILIVSFFAYICLTFGAATGKDVQTVMICRFFAGFTSIAPFVLGPSSIVDLFGYRDRSLANSLFSMSLFAGPAFAPIIAAYVVINPDLGWRWNAYITGIISSAVLVANIFVMEETHHGMILSSNAEEIRRRTDNWAIYAAHEQVRLSVKEIATKTLIRPFQMLLVEPILVLFTFYTAFIYGLLYAFLTIIPYTFSHSYGWHEGKSQLPYAGILIGLAIGAFISYQYDLRYNRILERQGRPVAEERLPPLIIGALSFTIGLFWLVWTASYPKHVHWIVPCLGVVVTGVGFFLSYVPCITYLLDCYNIFAASAISGNTIIRSFAAVAFPLFMPQMLDAMTIKWAGTLLGGVGAVMIPASILLYKYGGYVRRNSRYAFADE